MNITGIQAFIENLSETKPINDLLDLLNDHDTKIAYLAVNDGDDNLVIIPDTDTYYADDGNCEVESDYSTHKDAAEDYVADGSWGDDTSKTQWISVSTYRKGVNAEGEIVEFDRRDHKITLDPKEPVCTDDAGHDWITFESAQGHGAGVIYTDVCRHCGAKKQVDTWDYDPCDGQQGLESVEYSEADDDSREFLNRFCGDED